MKTIRSEATRRERPRCTRKYIEVFPDEGNKGGDVFMKTISDLN